jgi:hypothetical protein
MQTLDGVRQVRVQIADLGEIASLIFVLEFVRQQVEKFFEDCQQRAARFTIGRLVQEVPKVTDQQVLQNRRAGKSRATSFRTSTGKLRSFSR